MNIITYLILLLMCGLYVGCQENVSEQKVFSKQETERDIRKSSFFIQTHEIKEDSSGQQTLINWGGTAFVISKGDRYFLVSAGHMFIKNNGKIQNMYYETPNDFLSSFSIYRDISDTTVLHNQKIVTNPRQFEFYGIDNNEVIDLCVFLLSNPVDEIKEKSWPFEMLDSSTTVGFQARVFFIGYPEKYRRLYAYEGFAFNAPKFNTRGKFFFISETEENFVGMSGAPVYLVRPANQYSILGVNIGQNKKPSFGTSIFSNCIIKTIENLERKLGQ